MNLTQFNFNQKLENIITDQVENKIWSELWMHMPHYKDLSNITWKNITNPILEQFCTPLRSCINSKLRDYEFNPI